MVRWHQIHDSICLFLFNLWVCFYFYAWWNVVVMHWAFVPVCVSLQLEISQSEEGCIKWSTTSCDTSGCNAAWVLECLISSSENTEAREYACQPSNWHFQKESTALAPSLCLLTHESFKGCIAQPFFFGKSIEDLRLLWRYYCCLYPLWDDIHRLYFG